MFEEQIFLNTLKSILQKNYQERNQSENDILTAFLNKLLPSYSKQQCIWLSLLCNYYPSLSNPQLVSHLQIQPQTIVIYPNIDKRSFSVVIIKQEQDLAHVPQQHFVIFVTKRNIQNSIAFTGQSIEEIIRTLRSFEYLSDIPRKRFYHIVRNLDLMQFSFNQVVYLQNELIEHDYYVYLVKKGQFTFLKRQKSAHKNVQLYTFAEGYIFGTEQQSEHQNKYGQIQRVVKDRRNFTVKCQSSQSFVYRIKADFFNSFLRKFCETLLKTNNVKLNRFIQQRLINAEMNFTKNAQFITQPYKRSLSIPIISKRHSMGLQKDKHINQISRNQVKKSVLPLLHMKSQLPKRKKLLSKQQLINLSPQYQQQKIILMRQYKCQVLRQSTKGLINPPCKGQILLNLMKTTYQFQKARNKKPFN